MTKKIGIATIFLYQVILSPFIKASMGTNRSCRFPETCSAYTKRQIKENGLLRGGAFGFVRLLKCQPFFNS